jgi:hypothetical protein
VCCVYRPANHGQMAGSSARSLDKLLSMSGVEHLSVSGVSALLLNGLGKNEKNVKFQIIF